MRHRSAISIAELLVVMSACSIILTMSAALVHRVMRSQSDSHAFYDAERSALRLSRQFRQDVHHATSASIDNEDQSGKLLRLKLQDGRAVEYRHLERRVLRNSTHVGGRPARDEFAFPSPFEFAVREVDSPRRIMLSITIKREEAAGAQAMSGDMLVEATLQRASVRGKTP